MLYIVIICAVFVVAVLFIRYRELSLRTPIAKPRKRVQLDEDEAMYERAASFLSAPEQALFKALSKSLHGQATLLSKVQVSEVATLTRVSSSQAALRSKNTVFNSHFDFLVCRSDDLEPLCAVEINRRGITRARGLATKNFKLQICAAIDLPIVFVEEKNKYLAAELRGDVVEFLPATDSPTQRQTTTTTPKTKPAVKSPRAPLATIKQTTKNPAAAKPKATKAIAAKAAARPMHKATSPKQPAPQLTTTGKPKVPVARQASKVEAAAPRPKSTPAEPLCPRCKSPTVIKVATKGANVGKKFRVCSDFPNCRTASPA